jgi:hypothetical protein
MNKTVGLIIPAKAHKQFSSTPARSVCAHLKHFARRIQSSPLWSSETRPLQNNQRHVSLFTSNRQRKEQLGQCPNLMECQTALDPGKPFFSSF